MQVNDLVARISYDKDIIFRIVKINGDKAILKGVYIRLLADSPLSDLIVITKDELNNRSVSDHSCYKDMIQKTKEELRHITGIILHLDSDLAYLEKCLKVYNDLGLKSYGVFLDEPEFKLHILDLIRLTNPAIIVLTGHDSYNRKGQLDIRNYLNTEHFINTIRTIRMQYSLDDIFIFAGACQSNFEALIESGANFASSADRTNIDAYDPAIVAVKAAITHFTKIIDIKEMFTYTKTTKSSITGVESYGKMRVLL